MHYKNGREAKNGDKVVFMVPGGATIVGILYDATTGQDYCNGRLAMITTADPFPNLKECLHLDDVTKAIVDSPACAQPVPPPADAPPAPEPTAPA